MWTREASGRLSVFVILLSKGDRQTCPRSSPPEDQLVMSSEVRGWTLKSCSEISPLVLLMKS